MFRLFHMIIQKHCVAKILASCVVGPCFDHRSQEFYDVYRGNGRENIKRQTGREEGWMDRRKEDINDERMRTVKEE